MSVFWERKWPSASSHLLLHLSLHSAQPNDPARFSVPQRWPPACLWPDPWSLVDAKGQHVSPGAEANHQLTSWKSLLWNVIPCSPCCFYSLLCLNRYTLKICLAFLFVWTAYWPPTCLKAEVKLASLLGKISNPFSAQGLYLGCSPPLLCSPSDFTCSMTSSTSLVLIAVCNIVTHLLVINNLLFVSSIIIYVPWE